MSNVSEWIGGYRLRNLLQTGQFSQVWEVIEPKSGRHFALKVLLPETATNAYFRDELFHEAEVGQSLNKPKPHPNVIQIVKVSKDRYQPHFVMEFFPSGSLRRRLMNQEHDFIKEHAQKIMKDSAAAFAFMNKSGWCHRDIKPDNILVDATGVVKIIDFAISKRVPGTFGRWFHKRGKPSGTRSYMSPQQIRDEPPDWRDDIYSYGATLYDLFAGRPPFRGLSEEDLMNKQLFATPDAPSVYNRALTEEFDKFVLWMLAKKRDDRPRNFYEILMKLKTLRVWKVGRK